jgi:multiple sugar transport system ATP-binding protein
MSAIEIRGVSKRFGITPVLHELDLTVASGEFLVLVGPSGCGKSTLLRLIAGLEEVSDGEIRIGGRRVNELPPKARDIAMVFQSYALYPHMSVADNMAYSLRLRRTAPAEIARAVGAAAGKLGLESLLARKPKALSGGQRQRVAMGRAIVRKPGAFLFDEPLSNLDARLREHMRAEIKKLHRELGATSIYVTHDQIEAMTMADRIVVMRDGVVEQLGAPLELYDRPATLFVASFIGSPSMNLLKGAVTIKGKPVFVTEGGVELPLKSAPPNIDGRPCIYGIRPEHLAIGSDFKAEVSVVEPTGSETQVFAKVGGHPIVTVFRDRISAQPGQSLLLSPNLDAVHLFDAESGKRLE